MADVQSLTDIYNTFRDAHGQHGKPMSHREAARRAGDEEMRETFRKIGVGQHAGNIEEETVEALVRLGLNERAVRRAAGLQMDHSLGRFDLPARANRLSMGQRQVVLSVVDAILNAASTATATPHRPLRAVADKQRGPTTAAASEASEKAAKARREQGQ